MGVWNQSYQQLSRAYRPLLVVEEQIKGIHKRLANPENMGKRYTDAQKRASGNYMQDKHVIRVVVTKEKAEEYKKRAAEDGKSLNQYIIKQIWHPVLVGTGIIYRETGSKVAQWWN